MSALCRSMLVLAFIVGSGACSDSESDEAVYLQLSYESIPGSGVALPQGTIDTSGSDYADKLALTRDVFDVLVPDIMDAVGVDAALVTSEITPGGFLLETNPSMQTRMLVGDDTDAVAERLAAALGYTMYQWSVLVTDFAATDGDTGYAVVRFDRAIDAQLAQAFFAHAAAVDGGLGGGYLVFDSDMIFLNVRDDSGNPYSELEDAAFVAALEDASAGFTEAQVEFFASGFADARFVGNDWDAAPDGDGYLATVGQQVTLAPLQDSFAQMIADASATYGWTVTPQALRAPATPPGIRRGHWRELTTIGQLPAALAR